MTVIEPAAFCRQPCRCSSTKALLTRAGVEFTIKRVNYKEIQQQGYIHFPVVIVDLGDGSQWSWSGFKKENVARLVDLIR